MGVLTWTDLGSLDDLGRRDTPIHRLDARVKAAVTLCFLLVVMSFNRYEVSALTPLVAYPLFLVVVGEVPAGLLLRKLLLAAPFALMVGLLNPWLDRAPGVLLGTWSVSAGWLSCASIALRFLLTVGAAVALIACTGLYRLAAGLQQLGLPHVLVTQLLLLYRYLFVVAEEGRQMRQSVQARGGTGSALPLRTYGHLIGHLLLRSLDRAARVHRAMLARGFDGSVRVAAPPSAGARDVGFAVAWIAFFLIVRFAHPADRLGAWIIGGSR